MSCVSNTSCLGGSLFCSGLLVDLNRAGDSLYQGGEFFAEIQRGVRRTTAVGKRVDTYGFYPLNSCFPLLLSLAQIRDRRPPCKRERQRIFSTVGEHSVLPFLYLFAVSDTLLLHIRATLRWVRHNSAAQFVSVLLQTAPADLIFEIYIISYP